MSEGEKYAWENKDGRVFYGTPMELVREFPEDDLDVAYVYKIINDEYEHYKTFKGWRDIETPNPGSDKALDMGGKCPVLDNAHGKGYKGMEGRFVIVPSCPLHGEE